MGGIRWRTRSFRPGALQAQGRDRTSFGGSTWVGWDIRVVLQERGRQKASGGASVVSGWPLTSVLNTRRAIQALGHR